MRRLFWPFRRREKVYTGSTPLPLGKWVRVAGRMRCGCYSTSHAQVTTPASPEIVLNRYGSMIGMPPDHTGWHLEACKEWLKIHDTEIVVEWFIDHDERGAMPRIEA